MPDEVSLMVTTEGLTALADMALASKSQSRLDELLAKNVEVKLSAQETKELDLLLTQIEAPTELSRPPLCLSDSIGRAILLLDVDGQIRFLPPLLTHRSYSLKSDSVGRKQSAL
ncbi:MAG: hypothetical protein SFV81_30695 [Pirellulaceae bacterium]|nr:hypothetical protein [Pirellulaceae bacterium]